MLKCFFSFSFIFCYFPSSSCASRNLMKIFFRQKIISFWGFCLLCEVLVMQNDDKFYLVLTGAWIGFNKNWGNFLRETSRENRKKGNFRFCSSRFIDSSELCSVPTESVQLKINFFKSNVFCFRTSSIKR